MVNSRCSKKFGRVKSGVLMIGKWLYCSGQDYVIYRSVFPLTKPCPLVAALHAWSTCPPFSKIPKKVTPISLGVCAVFNIKCVAKPISLFAEFSFFLVRNTKLSAERPILHCDWLNVAMRWSLSWNIQKPKVWVRAAHSEYKRKVKSPNHQYQFSSRAVKMHGQTQSSNTHIRKLLTRKVKTSMMHIFDVVKARVSQKAKKASSRSTQQSTASKQGHNMKAPLTRKLTQDEINEAELALERLQAEKRRLEDLLNRVSDKHSISSQKSYSNSCEDVSNNNVHKELVRVPRYQQKTAFILHNVFSAEVSINSNYFSNFVIWNLLHHAGALHPKFWQWAYLVCWVSMN